MSGEYIPAYGPLGAKIFILGDNPSYDETKTFESSRELDKLCRDAGITRANCWQSNVCKYFVPPNTKGKKIPWVTRATNHGIKVEECLEELQNELNSIQPNVVLALGGAALWAMTGKTKIGNFRGSILHGRGFKTIATYHPKDLSFNSDSPEFMGYWNRQIMVFDFKRAFTQSHFSELILPSRTLSVCRSSYQLADFLKRHEGHINPAVDIEARGTCLPACIGLAFTPNEGMTVPLWNAGEYHEILGNIPDAEMVSMWILLSNALANADVVGQYFNYDRDKILRLGFTVKSLFSDTLLKAFCINPELPKSLAFNTSIYTEEPYYKDEGMYEGSLEDLFLGCARDGCVTKEVDLAMDPDIDELGLREFYQNFLMKLPVLYGEIEAEGFTIDYKARDALFEKYIKWSEALAHELYTIVGDEVNVNSHTQVSLLLFENWKLPWRKGTGEEEITALLNNQGKTGVHDTAKRRGLEIILEKRRVDKSIGTYLMALPDFDGKMKTTYFPCLETGRTSTGQLDPPTRPCLDTVKNVWVARRKKSGKYKSIGTAFQTMTKHGDIGQDIRSQYVVEDGYVFVQADKAQAEARVVFLLADDEQALKDIDEHDYHALTASWFFGGIEDDYSKRKLGYESPIRFAGKTLRHAGHLGAGKRRAATSVNTDARKYKIPIQITEQIAERALKIFHIKQPKIQQVFQAGIREALEQGRTLTAPVPYEVDSKIGGKRTFFERWGEELYRQAYSYIPQRAISDSVKADALRLKKREPSLRIILESHDSLLFMIPEKELNYFCPLIKEEMERPIRFDTCSLPRRDLIVPCEIEIGYNYQDLSKWRG